MTTGSGSDPLLFQIWRPSKSGSLFSRYAQLQIPAGTKKAGYYLAKISLTGSNQIEIQNGDVIGYYQPFNPERRIWNVQTTGYNSAYRDDSSPPDTFNPNNVDGYINDQQPLIEVMFGENDFTVADNIYYSIT